MNKILDVVPENNITAFRLLYTFEVGLREILIDVFEAKYGPRAWKEALPESISGRLHGHVQTARDGRWRTYVPQHPMHYLDFADLAAILSTDAYWPEMLTYVLRRGMVTEQLTLLEQIRNHVHNHRRVTDEQLSKLRTILYTIAHKTSEASLAWRITHMATASDAAPLIEQALDEVSENREHCLHRQPLRPMPAWERVRVAWWFDPDYVDIPTTACQRLDSLLSAYTQHYDELQDQTLLDKWLAETAFAATVAHAEGELYGYQGAVAEW